jgi:hypothetical protein
MAQKKTKIKNDNNTGQKKSPYSQTIRKHMNKISFPLTMSVNFKIDKLQRLKKELDFVDSGHLTDFKAWTVKSKEVTITDEAQLLPTQGLCYCRVHSANNFPVSLFTFVTWDRSQLVGLNIPFHSIVKPSYSGNITNPNVASNCTLISCPQ